MTLPSASSVSHSHSSLHLGANLSFLFVKGMVLMSSVVDTWECPSSPDTVATSAPPEIIRLAAVCRRL